MKTETIEWFTPQERLPENEQEVLIKIDEKENCFWWVIHAIHYSGEFQSIWGNKYNPTYWSAMPKGPQ